MSVVNSKEDIEQNLALFEDYLCDGTEEEQLFASNLIKKGFCFIAYERGGEPRFSPSRYAGYYQNDMPKHNQNFAKNGNETK